MNTEELKAAEAALEEALDKVRQLLASEPEQKPKPAPVRGPLTVAPEYGDGYWYVSDNGDIEHVTWSNDDIDHCYFLRGNAFATERDADYKVAFDEIWGQPIGEWEPGGCAYIAVSWTYNPRCWGRINDNDMNGLRRQWRKGEVGFGDAGRGVLKRRLAEQKKLDERFGL